MAKRLAPDPLAYRDPFEELFERDLDPAPSGEGENFDLQLTPQEEFVRDLKRKDLGSAEGTGPDIGFVNMREFVRERPELLDPDTPREPTPGLVDPFTLSASDLRDYILRADPVHGGDPAPFGGAFDAQFLFDFAQQERPDFKGFTIDPTGERGELIPVAGLPPNVGLDVKTGRLWRRNRVHSGYSEEWTDQGTIDQLPADKRLLAGISMRLGLEGKVPSFTPEPPPEDYNYIYPNLQEGPFQPPPDFDLSTLSPEERMLLEAVRWYSTPWELTEDIGFGTGLTEMVAGGLEMGGQGFNSVVPGISIPARGAAFGIRELGGRPTDIDQLWRESLLDLVNVGGAYAGGQMNTNPALTGAVTGGATEALRQWLYGEKVDPYRIGTSTLTGGLPGLASRP